VALTVAVADASREYGAPNPRFSTKIYGPGPVPAGITGFASCQSPATATSAPGAYPITCTRGTLAAAGYSFTTFVPGTLTVSQAAIAISASAAAGTYQLVPTVKGGTANYAHVVTVKATLVSTVTGAPVAGQTVTFTETFAASPPNPNIGQVTCSAVTDGQGVATCELLKSIPLGLVYSRPDTYSANAAGSVDYLGATSAPAALTWTQLPSAAS
jgi:hypothetical protein